MGDPAYVYVTAQPGPPVARTVGLDDGVNVDLDADGRLIGIERLDGPVTTAVLHRVLRAVRWTEFGTGER